MGKHGKDFSAISILCRSPFLEVLSQSQGLSDFFRFSSKVWKPGQTIIGIAWCFSGSQHFGETWHLLRLVICFSSCEEMLGRWIHKILPLSAPLLLVLFVSWCTKLCFMGCWERLRSKLMWFNHDTFSKKRSSKDRKSSMKTIRLHRSFLYFMLSWDHKKKGSGQRPNISPCLFPYAPHLT